MSALDAGARVRIRSPRFDRDEKKRIKDTPQNIMLALQALGVRVRYDEFAREERIDGLDGYGPCLDDEATNHLRVLFAETFRFRVGKEWFFDVISDRARRNRFHPVREYLASLKWDETPRIDRWLVKYAGAPDTPYVRAVSRLLLVAAVRRVRRPARSSMRW